MKTSSVRSNNGFTLVELLVVITIIMVLASAGFAAGNAAIQRARKATALATATALETAVNNFYTEYGSMPEDGDQDTTVKTDDVTFLNVLLGREGTGANAMNTRGLKLLDVREGKAKKNGLVYSKDGSTVEGLFDPWGGVFNVMLDLNYDEKLSVQPKGSSSSINLNGRRVAVWSDGADGVSKTGKPGDDVKTWGP